MPKSSTKPRRSARGTLPSLFLLNCLAAVLAVSHEVSADELSDYSAQEQSPERTFSKLVREIVIHAAEDGFEETKHWNKTVTRFDGLSIRGLNIAQKRKRVRHGFCRRYDAVLVKPEETFRLEIEQLPADPDSHKSSFLVTAQLRARSEATFVHYVYGVKGLNGNAVAHATLQLRLILEIAPQFVFSLDSLVPDLHLNAEVAEVDLQLRDLDLQKLGPIKGDLAKIIGDGSREAVEGLIQAQESRIRKKLQKELNQIDGTDEKQHASQEQPAETR